MIEVRKTIQPHKKMHLRQGIKEMYFCQSEQVAILLTCDSVQIVDTVYCHVVRIIRRVAMPRFVRLAPNGLSFLVYYSTNTVIMFHTKSGTELAHVLGVPHSSTIFLISGNSQKLLYGNNQTLCIWNMVTSNIQMLTKQWNNINCYAINHDGTQLALGVYSGDIYLLTILGDHKCKQLTIKRHDTCVRCIAFHKDEIVSISHDKQLLMTSVKDTDDGKKAITFSVLTVHEIPREIISCGSTVYFQFLKGIMWFTGKGFVGFADGMYNVSHHQEKAHNQNKMLTFMRYNQAVLEWYQFKEVDLMLSSRIITRS